MSKRDVVNAMAEAMVAQAKSAGRFPAFFLMNPTSFDELLAESNKEHRARESALSRMFSRTSATFTLAGLPVVKSPELPVGGVFLHVAPPLGAQQDVSGGPGSMQVAQEQESPFYRREAVQENTDKPSINDLVQGDESGRPTVIGVLVKAVEHSDTMANVVVVRVYPNGNIDMSTTLDPYALQGVLHTAMVWAMQNGGGRG